jgi:hypothetical protein
MTSPTTVLNIWAGAGAGKSTTAADTFARMKRAGLSVELVTEYVKTQAWQGIPIGPWDDVIIFAEQLRRESVLYGKVDYIVTDSPLGLSAVYERHYHASQCTMRDLVCAVLKRQEAAGIKRVNCLLKRHPGVFDGAGRYETEAGARAVDRLVEEHLRMGRNRPFHFVDGASDVLRAAGLPGAV